MHFVQYYYLIVWFRSSLSVSFLSLSLSLSPASSSSLYVSLSPSLSHFRNCLLLTSVHLIFLYVSSYYYLFSHSYWSFVCKVCYFLYMLCAKIFLSSLFVSSFICFRNKIHLHVQLNRGLCIVCYNRNGFYDSRPMHFECIMSKRKHNANTQQFGIFALKSAQLPNKYRNVEVEENALIGFGFIFCANCIPVGGYVNPSTMPNT